jgi:unsaturated rhamnogalacturonyl hydrolase
VHAIAVGLILGATTSACSSSSNNSIPDDCGPDVSYDECYIEKRDPDSEQVQLATDIALRYIENHPFEDELWDWRSGVLMYALTELYRLTGDERLHDYYQSWLDYRIQQGYDMVWSDSCPPTITTVVLHDEMAEDRYQQVIDDTFDYLDNVAPRTEEGGISHNGVLGNTPSVWLDSLFMFGMVLNKYGELFDDEERLQMASDQIQIITGLLQDDDGFMRHATDWPGYDETIHWTRGNSWVVAALSDYLRVLVRRGASDAAVENVFKKHVAAILSAQDESGLWQTVMSHREEPGNYLETSGSALFTYGLARGYRYGTLGEAERDRALQGIEGVKGMIRMDEDGPVVTGVSLATDPWPLRDPNGYGAGYLDVPLGEDVNYGVGAVVLALIETSGLD